MASPRTEIQPYRIVRADHNFEVRYYPPTIMATVQLPVKTYKALANAGFRKLADYIFGGNEQHKKILMTSPVHMDFSDPVSSMSFVMPSGSHKENLPVPLDPGVKLSTNEHEYVAAISFSGFATDGRINTYSRKLRTYLEASSISYYGHFRFLGYNAPYTLFGRRNEIIVSVCWR
jgi:hypothetical protein